jgi:ankyrin repeat protein
VELLLGEDVSSVLSLDDTGITVMHRCAYIGHTAALKLLITKVSQSVVLLHYRTGTVKLSLSTAL